MADESKKDTAQNLGFGAMLVAESVNQQLRRAGVPVKKARTASDAVGADVLQGGNGTGALVSILRALKILPD